MNYILKGIPNDIYNDVDACLDAKQMWARIKRLMQGSDISQQERHSRLMNEFDKFVDVKRESLTSVYERFSTPINVMDQNNVRPQSIFINTKFLKSLQPEWSKYVTMTRQNYTLKTAEYDELFEPHVNASKAKKAERNHNPLALVANSHAHSSNSHANSSYSRSPQPYYVTHPSFVIDNDDDYQGDIQGDAQEDKLTTAMMLLARAITQRYSTPTNNRLRTSSNTRNQDVIQNGCVDIQIKNVGYAGNGNRNAGRKNKNQATNAGNGLVQSIEEYDHNVQKNPRTESTPGKANVQCYNCNEKGHYARECPKPRVRDAKYFREQILLATKDEARVHLDEEENDFMLDNAYGNNTLEELNAVVIMMTRIQPTDDKFDAKPTYDAEFISEVNALQVDMINGLLSKSNHEQHHHEKLETIIHTFADDQIDSDIIFDDPYMDNNSGQAEHDTNAHDQSLHDFESLIINVQERIKEFKIKPEQALDYKEAYEELQNELNVGKEQLLNEKEEIFEEILKTQDEPLKIKRETDLYKKAFKERENKYHEDIVSL
ncbi:integrase, catalytic region, zinc finger, CCHC-type containing protein [Tanacetum coccineum]